jgi:hypothetical protein
MVITHCCHPEALIFHDIITQKSLNWKNLCMCNLNIILETTHACLGIGVEKSKSPKLLNGRIKKAYNKKSQLNQK